MTDPRQALAAARAFATAGAPRRAERLGSGHIHDTWSVACTSERGQTRYVLQRLNERVFPDPHAVVENAGVVTRALEASLHGVPDAERRCLQCVETLEGALAHVDAEGGVWRSFVRIEGTRTWDSVQSPQQARRAARAFGEFTTRLASLDPRELRITIAGFHDFEGRLAELERASADDAAGRGAASRADLDAMRRTIESLLERLPPARLAALPPRIVHNDCKLNNVLFDQETDEALCVIDLDTVMPGTLLADFGDLVRTAACREPEDSLALERVRVEPELYEALVRGYLEGLGAELLPEELELLPLAGPLIALETGVRFLTDHLAGDRYFRVARPDHNLHRARTQLQLTRSLLTGLGEAEQLVRRTARDAGGLAHR